MSGSCFLGISFFMALHLYSVLQLIQGSQKMSVYWNVRLECLFHDCSASNFTWLWVPYWVIFNGLIPKFNHAKKYLIYLEKIKPYIFISNEPPSLLLLAVSRQESGAPVHGYNSSVYFFNHLFKMFPTVCLVIICKWLIWCFSFVLHSCTHSVNMRAAEMEC